MAARNRVGLSEYTRQRIQSTVLVKRLSDHAVGKCEMSATQVQAARILLGKSLPDLQAIEHSGKDGGAIVNKIEVALVHGQGRVP